MMLAGAAHLQRSAVCAVQANENVAEASSSANESPRGTLYPLKWMCHAMQGDENAAKKFQEVSKAYDTLRDPQKRQQYDSMGADGYERMAENGGAGWSPVHPP